MTQVKCAKDFEDFGLKIPSKICPFAQKHLFKGEDNQSNEVESDEEGESEYDSAASESDYSQGNS